MLVRSAQGLYWMSRYLERARRLCRLLQLQTESLVDRPVREIHFGWSRIYASVNRLPPAGRIELLGSDDYTLADSYTLAGDLTFERSNPDSVWSCFDQGRENARQIRQSISTPMWTQLNLAYLRLQELEMPDIWAISPESFYADTVAQIDTFVGVAAATMYRGEGWRFMQLGRFIERAQLLAALLVAQLDRGAAGRRGFRRGLDRLAASLPRGRGLQPPLQRGGAAAPGAGPAGHGPAPAGLAGPVD